MKRNGFWFANKDIFKKDSSFIISRSAGPSFTLFVFWWHGMTDDVLDVVWKGKASYHPLTHVVDGYEVSPYSSGYPDNTHTHRHTHSISLHPPKHLLNACMWPIKFDLIWAVFNDPHSLGSHSPWSFPCYRGIEPIALKSWNIRNVKKINNEYWGKWNWKKSHEKS
jgi:hypothetical protein